MKFKQVPEGGNKKVMERNANYNLELRAQELEKKM